ncbi:Methyltransferase domain-containing protein OS=Streptomyces microflavus OX=1919 GN=Smic_21760 PE=4 SV=1 [Streptomyces microflavus]
MVEELGESAREQIREKLLHLFTQHTVAAPDGNGVCVDYLYAKISPA